MTAIEEVIQSLTPDEMVMLFIVDTSVLGDPNGPYHITPTTDQNNGIVSFGGVDFVPVPVVAEGFEVTGQGAIPQPKMTLSNINSIFTQVAIGYGNLVGAGVQRIRTFARYLDNGSEPDGAAYLPVDHYVVERMVERTNDRLILQLSAAMDQEGRTFPGRQVVRNYCQWRYRRFDSDSMDFDYTHVYCPYQGSNYFKRDGTPTSIASEDVCGKRQSDCEARFGSTAELPMGAFRAVGLTRPG